MTLKRHQRRPIPCYIQSLTFACVQAASWIVPVRRRLMLGLQATLFVTLTPGHVLCALFIYMLCWRKPRMVLKHKLLERDWAAPLCVSMNMSSRIKGRTTCPTPLNDYLEILFF